MKRKLLYFLSAFFICFCMFGYNAFATTIIPAGTEVKVVKEFTVSYNIKTPNQTYSGEATHKTGTTITLVKDYKSGDSQAYFEEVKSVQSTNYTDPIDYSDIVSTDASNLDLDMNKYGKEYDFWAQASRWFSLGKKEHGTIGHVGQSAIEIISEFEDMVSVLGTTVIVLVTIFLGIKYMFGTFESKADVKESLVTLLVACVFFFGWTLIWNLLFPNGEFVFNPSNAESYKTPLGIVFSTATSIANFLAIGAILYVGIKYIFAGADGKAELKGKSVQFIIGIIMAFCTVGLLNYISNIVVEVLS